MPHVENPQSPLVAKLKGLHLFHFDGAPCAQRVRFALGEKGLSRGREERFDADSPSAVSGESGRWVSRVVSLVKKDHMTPAYAQIHPNMVVPALVNDGELFIESMDIIDYLDQTFAGPQLIPESLPEREEALDLTEQAKALHLSIRYVTFHWGLGRLAMLNQKERDDLTDLASLGSDEENLVAFYDEYSRRAIPASVFESHLMRLHSAFSELDERLQDGRMFLVGDSLSIGDIFWAMKMPRLIETGYPLAAHHVHLQAWYERIQARPAFQNEVMGRNRLSHRLFRVKAGIERRLGGGLNRSLEKLLAA